MYSNELVCKIIDYINNNINKKISINELSELFYYDKTYIMKKFKKEVGCSINNYINCIKIYNSLSYFNSDNYILSIALKNGFNSIEYYSEIFKKIIGVSPIIYKKYISYSPNISKKQEELIRKSILNLNLLNNKVNKYLANRKPTKEYNKVLTIFK